MWGPLNPIRREQLFDFILFNAPYLPVEEKPKGMGGLCVVWWREWKKRFR